MNTKHAENEDEINYKMFQLKYILMSNLIQTKIITNMILGTEIPIPLKSAEYLLYLRFIKKKFQF